jgi:hypothetical protein
MAAWVATGINVGSMVTPSLGIQVSITGLTGVMIGIELTSK